TLTFQAALRYILDRRKNALDKIRPKKDPDGKVMKKIAKMVCNHPLPILLIIAVVTIIMIGGAMQIDTGFSMEDFLPEDNPSVTVMMDISDDFPFSSQEKEYILVEGNVATVGTLQGIYQVHENLRDDTYILIDIDGYPKSDSILTLIQNEMKNNKTFASAYNLDSRGIPSSDSEVKQVFDYLFDNYALRFEVQGLLHKEGNKYDATLISVFTNVMNSDDDDLNNAMETVYNDLNKDIEDGFGNTDSVVTGENSMMYVIMNSMTESQILST
ncbi:unnamed protein product, partial [marine sediment metagenome]